MKATLGWTMLSREDMRRVDRSLATAAQDTRDEIGFLLLHQGFADRFFPGTSVLHTRLRYVLFVPWIYHRAVFSRARGRSEEANLRDYLIQLAIRLKRLGGEPYGVIGGDKLGQLTSQPPDFVYWTALRAWGLLSQSLSRTEALRRLKLRSSGAKLRDDDGNELDDDVNIDVFAGLPNGPRDWKDDEKPLHFLMDAEERKFLRDKLRIVARPGEPDLSLLACLVKAEARFPADSPILPKQVDRIADASDRAALTLARDAAAIAAIGRTIYGALVEELRSDEGVSTDSTFRSLLKEKIAFFGSHAARFDLEAARSMITLPEYLIDLLRQTQLFIQAGRPRAFMELLNVYRATEIRRKGNQRARLGNTPMSQERRYAWNPQRHNTDPLHYRWGVVRTMLEDLCPDI